jgi:hypothetical protein
MATGLVDVLVREDRRAAARRPVLLATSGTCREGCLARTCDRYSATGTPDYRRAAARENRLGRYSATGTPDYRRAAARENRLGHRPATGTPDYRRAAAREGLSAAV